MHDGRALVVWLAGLMLLVMAGCSGSDDGGEQIPPLSSSSPSSASPSPSPEADKPSSVAEATTMHVTVLGKSAAKTAEEKAVVKAWMTRWRAVGETYFDLEPAPGLDVSTGDALTNALDYLAELKSKGLRSVGWSRNNVLKVIVEGKQAAVRDCTENYTFNVDSDGKRVEKIVPFYRSIGSFERRDGRWVVTNVTVKYLDQSCLE